MRITFYAAFIAAITQIADAEPISLRDDLWLPVNPPKKVMSDRAIHMSTIRPPSIQHPLDPGSRQYIDALKVWNAAEALISYGRASEAIAIMENAKSRLETLQTVNPSFEPSYVSKLLSKISVKIESVSERLDTAEQGAAANP